MLKPCILSSGENVVTLYPERGGIITSMRIRDMELLYQGMLDETLHDTTKNVRGGIPILFPNAGFLTDEEKEITGWNLPQHGFARTNEWSVVDDSQHPGSVIPWSHSRESMTQEIDSCLRENDEQITDSSFVGMTKTGNRIIQFISSANIPDMFGYEWMGDIENTIVLYDEGVQLRYSIANNSDKKLPISWGLHPYWSVPLGDKSTIEWDFIGGEIIARDINNWSRGGTTRIDTPDDGIVRFTISGVGTIELHLSPEFRRLWIWSLPDKSFVCVEPVMGDDGHIVRDPVKIPAGGKSESWIKIIIVK